MSLVPVTTPYSRAAAAPPDDHDLGPVVQRGVDTLQESTELLGRVDPHATSVCFAKAEAKLSSPMFMR